MKQLTLIHGALGRKNEFKKIVSYLEDDFKVFLYEIPHHGSLFDSSLPFEMDHLIDHFRDFLNAVGPSYIYGFSLGGYLALATAQKNEKNILGIVTQGTKLYWSQEEATKETAGLNIKTLSTKAQTFYQYLLTLHGDNLPQLLRKTAQFMTGLGVHPLISAKSISDITIPVRFTRGGKDRMVTQSETCKIANVIEKAHYTEIPSMIHPIGFIKPKHIARLISTQIKSMDYCWAETPHGRMAYQQYREIKSKQQPVVLFLHESLGSIAQWKDFPKNLCEVLQLPGIALEFPGYGFSESEDKQRDYNYLHEFSWDVLPSFLDAIGLKNPLIIIGHSDGGTNALLYSKRYPNKVQAIVTIAAHYINESVTIDGIKKAVAAYNDGKLKGLELFHGQKTERLFFAWSNTWLLPEFKNWDISKDIKDNPVPALIIQGDEDQYGTDQQVNGIVKLIKKGAPCFISNCGHSPHLEKEDNVIQAIKNWIK